MQIAQIHAAAIEEKWPVQPELQPAGSTPNPTELHGNHPHRAQIHATPISCDGTAARARDASITVSARLVDIVGRMSNMSDRLSRRT
jgi:hypothetical protein